MNTHKKPPRFSLFDELDRGLNHLMNEVLQADTAPQPGQPPLSVYEFEDRYMVECDLPGVTLDDISLRVDDGVLQISGTRKDPVSDDVSVTANERSFGDFSRKLTLGKEVDVAGVDAELGHGVLRVVVPKTENVLPKTINIRSAGENV